LTALGTSVCGWVLNSIDVRSLFALRSSLFALRALTRATLVGQVVDGESGKHAFLGLGFESRDVAGDFFSSLVDHVQYVERQTREGERGERGAQPLNAPVTLHLNSNSGLSHSGAGFVSGKKEGLSKTFSLMFAKGGGVEAALSSASTDSPLGGSSRRGTGTDTEAEFDGGWGAFESAEDS